jgi:hypothetical protein
MPEISDFSDCAIYCDHANEMPVVCPCKPNCYCHKHGGCGRREARLSEAAPSYEVLSVYAVHQFAAFTSLPEQINPVTSVCLTEEHANITADLPLDYTSLVGRRKVSSCQALRLSDGNIYILFQPSPVHLEDRQKLIDEAIRGQAMAKLSVEEKRVLGIKE